MKSGTTTPKTESQTTTEKDQKYFGGWPGAEHIEYKGDYHTDGKKHQPLEKVAKEVAEQQKSDKSS